MPEMESRQLAAPGALLVTLPTFAEAKRGTLTFAQCYYHVPFVVKRAFWISDAPAGTVRGAHAHASCKQFLVCVSGSVHVTVDDGLGNTDEVLLRGAHMGVSIPPMTWSCQRYASEGSVLLLVLCSEEFNAGEYVTDYENFKAAKQASASNGAVVATGTSTAQHSSVCTATVTYLINGLPTL